MSADPGAVLITGCSSGIGHQTALRLAGRGWTDYATARRPESIADLAEAGCKIAGARRHRRGLDAGRGRGGRGRARRGRGARQQRRLQPVGRRRDPADGAPARGSSRPTCSASCGCASWCSRRCAAAGRGRIVNVSSMGGKLVFPGGGAYHASKYAVEALSDALRFEVRGFGIRVVIIEPGLITTSFGETAAGSLADAGPPSDAERDRRPVRDLQRRGRRRDRGRLRGPDEAARRRPGHGREDDRARDLLAQPQAALQGHGLGEAGARPARAAHRPRLGRGSCAASSRPPAASPAVRGRRQRAAYTRPGDRRGIRSPGADRRRDRAPRRRSAWPRAAARRSRRPRSRSRSPRSRTASTRRWRSRSTRLRADLARLHPAAHLPPGRGRPRAPS